MNKEPYRLDLNVQRQELIDSIQLWIDEASPNYRFRSMVGTAGIGKSWFMADLYWKLIDMDQLHIIWLDVSKKALHPKHGPHQPNIFEEEGRLNWLQTVVVESNQKYGREIFAVPPDIEFVAAFRGFVDAICQQNPPASVLLVDGYDEIESIADQEFLQEHILSRFWGGNSTRIVLARRDEDTITHLMLSWSDEVIRLDGFNAKQKQEQIKKRAQKAQSEVDTQQLLESLTPYISSNPFINTYLFMRAADHESHSITRSDLHDCFMDILDRAGLDSRPAKVLRDIANSLPETWTARELNAILEFNLEDPSLENLFNTGIVYQIAGTSRYQIEPGLYALLKS